MLSKEVVELSKQHSIIRDIFEYGMKRAKEVGAENVFDFSIGNPSVPAFLFDHIFECTFKLIIISCKTILLLSIINAKRAGISPARFRRKL